MPGNDLKTHVYFNFQGRFVNIKSLILCFFTSLSLLNHMLGTVDHFVNMKCRRTNQRQDDKRPPPLLQPAVQTCIFLPVLFLWATMVGPQPQNTFKESMLCCRRGTKMLAPSFDVLLFQRIDNCYSSPGTILMPL